MMQVEGDDLCMGMGSKWNNMRESQSLVIIDENSIDEESDPSDGFQFYRQNSCDAVEIENYDCLINVPY